MADARDRRTSAGNETPTSELEDKIVHGATEFAASANKTLKSVGVDTDVMARAAQGQATQLQKLIIDEISARPFRALGIAAAVGFVLGAWNAR